LNASVSMVNAERMKLYAMVTAMMAGQESCVTLLLIYILSARTRRKTLLEMAYTDQRYLKMKKCQVQSERIILVSKRTVKTIKFLTRQRRSKKLHQLFKTLLSLTKSSFIKIALSQSIQTCHDTIMKRRSHTLT
jgi:hypothetical protein